MTELFGRLADVSAVLAGFAITFLALLLGHHERNRYLIASMATTIVAAASLLVAAVGWTLIGVFLTHVSAQQGDAIPRPSEYEWILGRHRMLSFAFMAGLLFLTSTLGLSGWLRSRTLGIFSTACAFAAALSVWTILRHVLR